MAATTDALTILNDAALLLNDPLFVTWTSAELLEWLNLSQLEMVNIAPQSNIKHAVVKLVPGAKQQLPSDGILLLDIPYNYRATGTHISTIINRVPRQVMDKRIPNWVTVAPNQTVKHFVYDQVDPKTFYVYPAQPAFSTYVEMAYAAMPVTIPDINVGTKITVGDQYRNVLLNLVMYRALAKDSEYGNLDAKAQAYRALAMQELGVNQNPQQASAPLQQQPSRPQK